MKPNKTIVLSKKIFNKLPIPQTIIALITLVFFGSGYCFSQSNNTGQTMSSSISNIQIDNTTPVYLDKSDPIFISIKARTVADLKQRTDTASAENKLIVAKLRTLTEEKQIQLEAILVKSFTDYTSQTRGEFMLHFREVAEKDPKNIAEEYDFRVQNLGNNKYAAEYWEDGLAVNSEENALAWAQELVKRQEADKITPDIKGIVQEVKIKFEDVRNSIKSGKQERYTKVLALLYVQEKNGSVTFHDPYQELYNFVLK
ncbi:MAG: hypothetical protein WC879_14630 [Melioribacteraceae bacterium]